MFLTAELKLPMETGEIFTWNSEHRHFQYEMVKDVVLDQIVFIGRIDPKHIIRPPLNRVSGLISEKLTRAVIVGITDAEDMEFMIDSVPTGAKVFIPNLYMVDDRDKVMTAHDIWRNRLNFRNIHDTDFLFRPLALPNIGVGAKYENHRLSKTNSTIPVRTLSLQIVETKEPCLYGATLSNPTVYSMCRIIEDGKSNETQGDQDDYRIVRYTD